MTGSRRVRRAGLYVCRHVNYGPYGKIEEEREHHCCVLRRADGPYGLEPMVRSRNCRLAVSSLPGVRCDTCCRSERRSTATYRELMGVAGFAVFAFPILSFASTLLVTAIKVSLVQSWSTEGTVFWASVLLSQCVSHVPALVLRGRRNDGCTAVDGGRESVARRRPSSLDIARVCRARLANRASSLTIRAVPRERTQMPELTRMTRDPIVIAGKPCIRGMRVTVGTVAGLVRRRTVPRRDDPYLEADDIARGAVLRAA